VPPVKDEHAAPIDRAGALERIGGDAAFLDELLDLYDQEYSDKARALASAIEAGNADLVRTLGHGLKGSSANLSLPALRQAAADLEAAGRAGDLASAREALRRLEEAYRALKAFLD
jgi:HPt (histidine-containing phosphotransfer) domain-containing protein